MNDMSGGTLRSNIYAFLVKRINQDNTVPTLREIGEAVGATSTGHIDYHLRALERMGLLTRQTGTSRGIRLTQPRGIPIIGAIAAGTPLDIFPEIPGSREFLPLDHRFWKANVFALVVRGQSMIEDGISDGDSVVCQPQQAYRNGDILIATHLQSGVNGSATLKRFFHEEDHIRLQPANAAMQPLIIPRSIWEQEWTIQGKVIALFRHYDHLEEERGA